MKKIILILSALFFAVAIYYSYCGFISNKDLLGFFWFIPLTVVALFQDEIKRELFTPKMMLEFELAEPYCLETKIENRNNQGEALDEWPAYYFRFRVKNNGKVQAKSCECVIEELRLEEGGEWRRDVTFQPINLKWSNGKAKNEFMDINPQCPGWFCDFLHVKRMKARSAAERMYPTTPKENFASDDLLFDYEGAVPNSQCRKVRLGIRHRVKISSYSENASPVSREFEVAWSGKWKENSEEMFKEVQITAF